MCDLIRCIIFKRQYTAPSGAFCYYIGNVKSERIMSAAKFSKLLDYETLKQQFGDAEDHTPPAKTALQDTPEFDPEERLFSSSSAKDEKKPGLTGSRLRSYAFAVLTRKEYSKAELIEKLAL